MWLLSPQHLGVSPMVLFFCSRSWLLFHHGRTSHSSPPAACEQWGVSSFGAFMKKVAVEVDACSHTCRAHAQEWKSQTGGGRDGVLSAASQTRGHDSKGAVTVRCIRIVLHSRPLGNLGLNGSVTSLVSSGKSFNLF